jgi:hypothetical protein
LQVQNINPSYGRIKRLNGMFREKPVECGGGVDNVGRTCSSWGAEFMPKRLRDLLLGAPEAVPGDYILALTAVVGLMAAVFVRMI